MEPTFDADGYPTEETLKAIRKWDYHDFKGLMRYCHKAWKYPEYFIELDGHYQVHTVGWSGNESIIGALQDNMMFWAVCWLESRRGGHYLFEVPGSLDSVQRA